MDVILLLLVLSTVAQPSSDSSDYASSNSHDRKDKKEKVKFQVRLPSFFKKSLKKSKKADKSPSEKTSAKKQTSTTNPTTLLQMSEDDDVVENPSEIGKNSYFDALARCLHSMKKLRRNVIDVAFPETETKDSSAAGMVLKFQRLFQSISENRDKPAHYREAQKSLRKRRHSGDSSGLNVQHYYNSFIKLLRVYCDKTNEPSPLLINIVGGLFETYTQIPGTTLRPPVVHWLNPVVLSTDKDTFDQAITGYFQEKIAEEKDVAETILRKTVRLMPRYLVIQLVHDNGDHNLKPQFSYPSDFALESYAEVQERARYHLQAVVVYNAGEGYSAYVRHGQSWRLSAGSPSESVDARPWPLDTSNERNKAEAPCTLFYVKHKNVVVIPVLGQRARAAKRPSDSSSESSWETLSSDSSHFSSSGSSGSWTSLTSTSSDEDEPLEFDNEGAEAALEEVIDAIKGSIARSSQHYEKPPYTPQVKSLYHYIMDTHTRNGRTTAKRNEILFVVLFSIFAATRSSLLGGIESYWEALADQRLSRMLVAVQRRENMLVRKEFRRIDDKLLRKYKIESARVLLSYSLRFLNEDHLKIYFTIVLWSKQLGDLTNTYNKIFFQTEVVNVLNWTLWARRCMPKRSDLQEIYRLALAFLHPRDRPVRDGDAYIALSEVLGWTSSPPVFTVAELQSSIFAAVTQQPSLAQLRKHLNTIYAMSLTEAYLAMGEMKTLLAQAHAHYNTHNVSLNAAMDRADNLYSSRSILMASQGWTPSRGQSCAII